MTFILIGTKAALILGSIFAGIFVLGACKVIFDFFSSRKNIKQLKG